jgi:hypothetical protein
MDKSIAESEILYVCKGQKIQFPKRWSFARQHLYMQSPFQQRARGKILKQEKMVRRKQKTEKEV